MTETDLLAGGLLIVCVLVGLVLLIWTDRK